MEVKRLAMTFLTGISRKISLSIDDSMENPTEAKVVSTDTT